HEWRRYFLGVGRHERRPLGPPRPAASRPRLESRTRHVPPRAATGTRARLMLLQSASPRLIELEGAWSPLVAYNRVAVATLHAGRARIERALRGHAPRCPPRLRRPFLMEGRRAGRRRLRAPHVGRHCGISSLFRASIVQDEPRLAPRACLSRDDRDA